MSVHTHHTYCGVWLLWYTYIIVVEVPHPPVGSLAHIHDCVHVTPKHYVNSMMLHVTIITTIQQLQSRLIATQTDPTLYSENNMRAHTCT